MDDKDLWRLGSNVFKPPKHKGPTKTRDIKHLIKTLNRLQTDYPSISQYWDYKNFLNYWFANEKHYNTLDSLIDVQKAAYAALKHSEWNQPIREIKEWPALHEALIVANKLAPVVIHKLVLAWIAWVHKQKCEITDRLIWLNSLDREIGKAERALKTARRGDKKQIRQEIADMKSQRQTYLDKVRSDYSLSKCDLEELFGLKDAAAANTADGQTDAAAANEQEVYSYDRQQDQQQQ